MRRAYVDVSHFRSPYDAPGLTLTGLGAAAIPANWPGGRSYYDVSRFRAPYQDGYFQSNSFFGLGATVTPAPPPPPTPPADMLGSTLTLLGVGAVAGGALAFLFIKRKRPTS